MIEGLAFLAVAPWAAYALAQCIGRRIRSPYGAAVCLFIPLYMLGLLLVARRITGQVSWTYSLLVLILIVSALPWMFGFNRGSRERQRLGKTEPADVRTEEP